MKSHGKELDNWSYDEGIEPTFRSEKSVVRTPITGYRVTMAKDTDSSSTSEASTSDEEDDLTTNKILQGMPMPRRAEEKAAPTVELNFITPRAPGTRRRDVVGPASSTLAGIPRERQLSSGVPSSSTYDPRQLSRHPPTVPDRRASNIGGTRQPTIPAVWTSSSWTDDVVDNDVVYSSPHLLLGTPVSGESPRVGVSRRTATRSRRCTPSTTPHHGRSYE